MSVDLHQKYRLGEFELDSDKHLLSRNTEHVCLPDLPFQVLVYLVVNRQRYVSRRELIDRFWSGSDAYEETLTKCISTIRSQLDDPANAPRYIETRKKVGYRYIGPCQQLDQRDVLPEPPALEIEKVRGLSISVEEVDGVPQTFSVAGAQQGSRWKTPVLLLFAVLIIGAAVVLYERWPRRAATAENTSIRSIAVLPLRNLTGNPANDYFSDGLTESLIDFLSKVDGLSVQSRSSVFRFKNKDENLQELGTQLGVASVLEGSVRRVDQSVRVVVRLVSVNDGRVLWVNDSDDRPMPDLFSLQDQIAREVVAKLQLQMNADAESRLSHHYTDNVGAYQQYLQGRYFLNNFATYNDLLAAVRYFNAAIAKDPKYALAYSGLADTYIGMALDFRAPNEVFPLAREYAQKALELDDNLGEAHYSRGAIAYFYEWNWDKARQELNRAMSLNAKTLETNSCYLHSLETSEPPDQALEHVQSALDRNPLSIGISSELGCAAYYARRFDQAITFSLQTSEMDSGYVFVHYNMARALGQQNLHEEALKELQKAIAVWGRTPTALSEVGFNYAAMGNKVEARKILTELHARSQGQFTDSYPLAFIHIALGEKDQALTMLELAYREHSAWMPWIRVEPKFDSLHREPRFILLLKQLKMQPG